MATDLTLLLAWDRRKPPSEASHLQDLGNEMGNMGTNCPWS